MKKTLLILLTLVISFSFVSSANAAIYTDASVGTYEQELSKFPCDYQNKIKQLHNTYPNAVFVAQNIFFDWSKYKEIAVNWNDMLAAEFGNLSTGARNDKSWIDKNQPAAYRTSTCKQWSGSTCTWYLASKTGIEYYMNPYNFLDNTHVFMFESQLYNPNQTVDGLEKLLAGTFMSNKNCPGSNKTYAGVILEAAQKYSLSAYMLASRIKQEQGSAGTSGLISGNYSGYAGYYNYFNIGATGSTTAAVVTSGLAKAKEKGWTSPYLSIIGGAEFLRSKYIGANDKYGVKGQMTNYLQKWDVYGPQLGNQQYMQNIMAPYSESASTYKAYSSISGYNNLKYVFYIPIFTGAPNTTNTSCSSGGNTSNIPYKINGGYISGIAQGTSAGTVAANTKGTVTNASGQTKTSGSIATGDKVKVGNNTYTVVIYGDVNGDGQINKNDLLFVQSAAFGYTSLDNLKTKASDINKDGKVDRNDLLYVQSHVFGYSQIKQ